MRDRTLDWIIIGLCALMLVQRIMGGSMIIDDGPRKAALVRESSNDTDELEGLAKKTGDLVRDIGGRWIFLDSDAVSSNSEWKAWADMANADGSPTLVVGSEKSDKPRWSGNVDDSMTPNELFEMVMKH